MAHQLLLQWGMFTLILVFLCLFILELGACTGQTNKRTGETHNSAN